MSNAFFNVQQPLAPRLIQYLHCIALVVIAVALVYSVIGGVRMMTSTAPRPAAAMADAAQSAPSGQADANSSISAPRDRRMQPGMGRRMRMMAGLSPQLRGGLRILLALVRSLIAWMVIRVLAEIALAILALKPKSP